MKRNYLLDFVVGLFVLTGVVAFVILSIKVSGLHNITLTDDDYTIKASFANVGGLKTRSRVSIGGVNIGRVKTIDLDIDGTYDAIATLKIYNSFKDKIPGDSIASIRTSGLIGDNFVAITPGGSEDYLKSGDFISETHSALVLEDLISKYLFSKTEEPSGN